MKSLDQKWLLPFWLKASRSPLCVDIVAQVGVYVLKFPAGIGVTGEEHYVCGACFECGGDRRRCAGLLHLWLQVRFTYWIGQSTLDGEQSVVPPA
jgi:hypothetical protein